MIVDAATLDKATAYQLMIGLIVPRPIAWVGTRQPGGPDNLAPFSFFMGVQSAPPILAFSVSTGRGGTTKHTARNIEASGVFTVSLVEVPHFEAMHTSGGAWEESEFDVTGLARGVGTCVDAPFVADARAAMECRLQQAVSFSHTTVYFGEVLCFHLAPSLLSEGVLDPSRPEPVARLGGDLYQLPGAQVSLARVAVPDAKTS